MISTIDRKRIFIFVAIAYAIIVALALVIFLNGGLYKSYPYEMAPLASILISAAMFSPAVANITTRLITREGLSNTFLRPNLRRIWPVYLAAWILPLIAIILGGMVYYLLFPGKFDLSMQWAREVEMLPIPWAAEPWMVVTSKTILYSLLYAPVAMFLMFGEEFGWRAYLLPKLVPLGPRKAVLLVGAIWAVWHWPIIFMGYEFGLGYWGAPVTGPLLFVWVLLPQSAFYAWLTLRTGSVWPAAIGHAVNNAASGLMVNFIQGGWDQLIGPHTAGIIGSLGYFIIALPILLIPGALNLTASPRTIEPDAFQAMHQPT